MEISGFQGWEMFTTRHWTDALGRTAVLSSVKDTLIVSMAAATLGVVASALIAYGVTRTTWAGRKMLDTSWGEARHRQARRLASPGRGHSISAA